jgi:hypothetical protein
MDIGMHIDFVYVSEYELLVEGIAWSLFRLFLGVKFHDLLIMR